MTTAANRLAAANASLEAAQNRYDRTVVRHGSDSEQAKQALGDCGVAFERMMDARRAYYEPAGLVRT